MRKVSLAITIAIIGFTKIWSQNYPSNIASEHTSYVDSMLSGIDKRTIPTGILYDRVISLTGLQHLKANATINRAFFYQAYREIRNAAYENSAMITTDSLKAIADVYIYRDKVVPIGLMGYRFNYIDTLSLKKD